MTELTTRPDAGGVGMPLPRCCPGHTDWATLTQHLVDDFPELTISDIVREVSRAKDAIAAAALGDSDGIETAELIARHQLMLLAGHLTEMARLDPERHARGSTSQ